VHLDHCCQKWGVLSDLSQSEALLRVPFFVVFGFGMVVA
jgi:hypothetical protein